jgi:hypothetical protein
MSFAEAPAKENAILKKKKKPVVVTHTCEDGYSFQYYEGLSGYTQADYDEMISSVCD